MKEFNVTYVSSFVKIDDYKQDKFRNLLKDAEKRKSVIRWYAKDQYTYRNKIDWYGCDKDKVFGSPGELRQEVFNVLNTDYKHRTKNQRKLNQEETLQKEQFKVLTENLYNVTLRTELIQHLKQMIVYSKLPDRHKEFSNHYQSDESLQDSIFISEILKKNNFTIYLSKDDHYGEYGCVNFRKTLIDLNKVKLFITLTELDKEGHTISENIRPIILTFKKKEYEDLIFYNGNTGRTYTNPANKNLYNTAKNLFN